MGRQIVHRSLHHVDHDLHYSMSGPGDTNCVGCELALQYVQHGATEVATVDQLLAGKRIILGVTGGIAAYKSADLCSNWRRPVLKSM